MNDLSSQKFSDWCRNENVTDGEREHLAFALKKLRDVREPYTGTPRRKISYRDIMNELRSEAYRLEQQGNKYGVMPMLERAEIYDACCNLVLALLINHDSIEPILRRHRDRMGAHRT